MRYSYHTPEERRLRVFIVFLIIILIIIGIVLVNRCSGPEVSSPSESEDTIDTCLFSPTPGYKDTIISIDGTPSDSIIEEPSEKPKQPRREDKKDNNNGDTIIKGEGNGGEIPINEDSDDWDFSDYQDDEDPSLDDDADSSWIDDDSDDRGGSVGGHPHIVSRRDKPSNGPGTQYGGDDYGSRNIVPRPPKRLDTNGTHPQIKRDSPPVIIILVVLLIFYIFAKVVSRGGILIIWATTFDKLLVIGAGVLCFIAMLVEDAGGNSETIITLYTISGLMILASIVLSIMYNIGSLWNIFLSILAKAFVFFLTLWACLILIVILLIYFMFSVAKRSHDY